MYSGKRNGTEHKQSFVCTGLFLFCMQGTVTHDIHVMLGPFYTYETNMFVYECCNLVML